MDLLTVLSLSFWRSFQTLENFLVWSSSLPHLLRICVVIVAHLDGLMEVRKAPLLAGWPSGLVDGIRLSFAATNFWSFCVNRFQLVTWIVAGESRRYSTLVICIWKNQKDVFGLIYKIKLRQSSLLSSSESSFKNRYLTFSRPRSDSQGSWTNLSEKAWIGIPVMLSHGWRSWRLGSANSIK